MELTASRRGHDTPHPRLGLDPELRPAPPSPGRTPPEITTSTSSSSRTAVTPSEPSPRDPDAVSPSPSTERHPEVTRALGHMLAAVTTPAAAWWPRRRHPSRATLDAVTTVTLLPRPRAVHHRTATIVTRSPSTARSNLLNLCRQKPLPCYHLSLCILVDT